MQLYRKHKAKDDMFTS